jgi:hypothetical protein
MPGLRSYNFREGDRSEYLANYLLSGLGLVTPVPRQEDIGFDFYCQLADQEIGNLTFGYPFIVQVKSDSVTTIEYGSNNIDGWKREHIDWINRLELPLLFGIVDKRATQIDIYNCSPLRFIYHEHPDPSQLEFKPRIPNLAGDIGKPTFEAISGWNASDKGDGNKYTIDLGNPLVTITNDDIYNVAILAHKKGLLRKVVAMEQQNILYKKLKLPHFHWTLNIDTNNDFVAAWVYYSSNDDKVLINLYQTLGPGLISLAVNLRANKQEQLIKQIIPLLQEIPRDLIPKEIKNNYPDLFG